MTPTTLSWNQTLHQTRGDSLSDPESRAYYDRKRAEGKKHIAALICLTRRRTDVVYVMLRDGTYQAKTPAAA